MPSLRLQRVRELLKREIGEVIRREFPVSEAGLVTVNDVDVTGDLHSAVVFISILGNAEQQKRGLGLLAKHRNELDALAQALLRAESLNEKEIRELVSLPAPHIDDESSSPRAVRTA